MVLTIPQWRFQFPMLPAAICPKSIFSFSVYWRHSIRVSAFVEVPFHSFSSQLLEWMHSYFPTYLSLFCLISPPLGFKHNPAVWARLYEVWQRGLVAVAVCADWNVKLYIQPAAVGFGEDLNSLHPLYNASYTGAAFLLLSWHESSELRGGGNRRRKKRNDQPPLTSGFWNGHIQSLPFNKRTKRSIDWKRSSWSWFKFVKSYIRYFLRINNRFLFNRLLSLSSRVSPYLKLSNTLAPLLSSSSSCFWLPTRPVVVPRYLTSVA